MAVCDNESMVNDPTSLLPATETKTCMESFKEGSQINQTRYTSIVIFHIFMD